MDGKTGTNNYQEEDWSSSPALMSTNEPQDVEQVPSHHVGFGPSTGCQCKAKISARSCETVDKVAGVKMKSMASFKLLKQAQMLLFYDI